MSGNRYTGDVDHVINGKTYTLRADWDAIAKAQEAIGDANVLRKLFSLTTKQMAEVVAALLSHHHPEITAEDIKTMRPPLVPLTAALNEAILFAYTGADGIKEVTDAQAAKAAKKKTESATKSATR